MGPRPSLFAPEIAFDLLVKPQIKFQEASKSLMWSSMRSLWKYAINWTATLNTSFIASFPSFPCAFQELHRFPQLLIEVESDLLREEFSKSADAMRFTTRLPLPNFILFLARSESIGTRSSPPASSAPETFLLDYFFQTGLVPLLVQVHQHSHGHGLSEGGHLVPFGRDVPECSTWHFYVVRPFWLKNKVQK